MVGVAFVVVLVVGTLVTISMMRSRGVPLDVRLWW